jgi:molybdate transport system substrate-binding protein
MTALLFLPFTAPTQQTYAQTKPTASASADAAKAVRNDVVVSAAEDMRPVMQVIQPMFEKQTGYRLHVTYGSSADLSEQIRKGTQTDIFFSTDIHFAEQIVADNLTETHLPTPYAKGLLVLWARNDSRFKALAVEDLQRKDLKGVAVANPDRVPYGLTAVTALKRMKLWDNVAPHIVQADSLTQAAQFVVENTAELAIISQATAMSPQFRGVGHFVLFPLDQYPPIIQTAVILKNGTNREGAHRLLNFMLNDQVQTHLKDLGLQPVQ